jgi:hypothetical protein
VVKGASLAAQTYDWMSAADSGEQTEGINKTTESAKSFISDPPFPVLKPY